MVAKCGNFYFLGHKAAFSDAEAGEEKGQI
jgi:hypothetical protein